MPSESKMLEITGSMAKLSEVETLLLQKIGVSLRVRQQCL